MNTVLSILVLAAIALLAGAAWLWNRARKQAVLMAILAGVMIVNVALWAMPVAGGDSPLTKAERLDRQD